MDYVGPVLRSQGSFGEDGLSRGARGEGLIAGPSLFSVVFKPAGFISFRTITDNWFLVTRRLPEDLLGRDRSPSGSALLRSDLRGGPSLQTWRFRRNRPTSEVLG